MMKTSNYFILIVFSLLIAITQKVNAQDDCATAVNVTDLTGVVCATGAVSSTDAIGVASCEEGTLDTWFHFVAQGTYADITVTASTAGFRPEFVVIESGDNTCTGGFTYWTYNCFDGTGNYTSLTGTAYDLTPGNDYWIVVTSNNDETTGTLDVCVNNPVNPVNDYCANAVTLPLDGTCINGTTQNSLDDFSGVVGCQNGGVATHNDVWFTFVADNPSINFNLIAGTMTGNAEITIFSGDCVTYSTHSYICGAMPLTDDIPAFIPGNTYMVLVSTSGTDGSFQLCATSFIPVAVPGQDCPDAQQLCDASNFGVGTINSGGGAITGNGSNEDMTFVGSCFGGQESQAQWYQFSVNTTGDLEFQIDPSTWGDDYDWAVFDITTTGCVIANNIPVACNWSGCYGMTGITSNVAQYTGGTTGTSDYYYGNPAGAGDCEGTPGSIDNGNGASQWENAITVTAGRSYAILINNYSNTSNDGFSFSFGGTDAGIGVSAGLKLTGGGCTNYNVTVEDTIASLNSATYTWDWGDGSAVAVGPSTNTHDYTAAGPGTYQVHVVVTDLIGCTKDYYVTVAVGTTIAAHAGPDVAICNGTTTGIGDSPAATGGNGIYTYAWTPNDGTLSSLIAANPNATPAATTTYTLTVTDGLGCTATDNITVTVNQIPTVTNPTLAQTICSGNNTTFNPTSAVGGTTFSWTASASAGTITGFSASGSGNINETITNSGTTSGTVTYVITPTGPAPTNCVGTPVNFVVTVNPIPSITNGTLTQTICSGDNATFTPTSNIVGTTYGWTASASAGTITGFSAVGSGNINEIITNSGASSGTVTYVITPTATLCSGTPVNYVVTVNPNPTFSAVGSNPSGCGGNDGAITISGLSASTSYDVSYSFNLGAPIVGTYASSAGGTIILNSLAAGSYDNITVTLNSTGCVSATSNVTLTNPGAPDVDDIPDVVQCGGSYTLLAITGSGLSGGESYNSAPANGGTAYNVGDVISAIGTTTIYIYDSNGGGCDDQEVFTVTIGAVPTVTNVSLAQTICSGSNASFTPTSSVGGTTFTWTATASAGTITGFSSSGSGPINETLFNSANASGTVTYVITPTGPAPSNCVGASVNFVVTVNPIPSVTNVTLTQTICSGSNATFTPTSAVAGTSFAWTASASAGTITGYSASGTGNINETVTNSGTSSGIVTYVITPTAASCSGTPVNFVVTVNPIPAVTNGSLTQTLCSGSNATFAPTSGVTGTTFAWTASASAGTITGYSASGTGNINETVTNSGASSGTVTYVITPTAASCSGTPVNFAVTVNPIPTVTNATLTQTICSGSNATFTPTSGVTGTTFAWTASASNGTITGYSASGSGNINQTINNSGATSGTVTYVITPTAASCPGTPVNFVVTVNPIPSVTNSPLNASICSGTTINVPLTSNVGGTTFAWTASASAGTITGYTPSGNGDINETLTNSGVTPGTVTYVITPTAATCTGIPVNFVVTVNPIPSVTNATLTQTICSGSNANLTPTSDVTGTIFNWTAAASSVALTGYSASGIGAINEPINNSGSTSETVTYSITPVSTDGCIGTTVDFVVTVDPTGDPSFTFADFCEGAANTPVITGDTGGNFSFNPAVSDGATINSTTGIISNGIGGTTYTVEYDLGGCAGSSNVDVTVNAIPSVPTVTGGATYCSNMSIYPLVATGGGGTFEWFSDAQLLNSIGTGFSLIPSTTIGTTDYYVTETENGCVSSPAMTSVTIEQCEIDIPTAFTPNNDGTDDTWEIENIDTYYPENIVKIYNRWGSLLYTSDKGKYTSAPWDGKFNGVDLPVASYYYIVEFNDGTTDPKTGIVSIIK